MNKYAFAIAVVVFTVIATYIIYVLGNHDPVKERLVENFVTEHNDFVNELVLYRNDSNRSGSYVEEQVLITYNSFNKYRSYVGIKANDDYFVVLALTKIFVHNNVPRSEINMIIDQAQEIYESMEL